VQSQIGRSVAAEVRAIGGIVEPAAECGEGQARADTAKLAIDFHARASLRSARQHSVGSDGIRSAMGSSHVRYVCARHRRVLTAELTFHPRMRAFPIFMGRSPTAVVCVYDEILDASLVGTKAPIPCRSHLSETDFALLEVSGCRSGLPNAGK